ncbi:7640_t:CDS:2 [Ambispora gerdemannii]|uniref:7640_t:CDS:1 n=1 Tax=Ambispora gerdemannii TaxID=144530 RepID=A0A9N9F7E0_9GLOM|nr:7640_t:CDS:2 [Ambispora gerdemannii]
MDKKTNYQNGLVNSVQNKYALYPESMPNPFPRVYHIELDHPGTVPNLEISANFIQAG